MILKIKLKSNVSLSYVLENLVSTRYFYDLKVSPSYRNWGSICCWKLFLLLVHSGWLPRKTTWNERTARRRRRSWTSFDSSTRCVAITRNSRSRNNNSSPSWKISCPRRTTSAKMYVQLCLNILFWRCSCWFSVQQREMVSIHEIGFPLNEFIISSMSIFFHD